LPVIGVDNLPGAVPIEGYALPRECVLLFGQEGPGLSREAHEGCDVVLSIAQFGSTRSINAGAAAAIAMHAWIRQHAG
jgi:tRNA G18 (ribose-2'-O)-methylase SpoU